MPWDELTASEGRRVIENQDAETSRHPSYVLDLSAVTTHVRSYNPVNIRHLRYLTTNHTKKILVPPSADVATQMKNT